MSALKRYIDRKENSIEEDELIVQNLEKKILFGKNCMKQQFAELNSLRDLYRNCLCLLEIGGIGIFYEFYHDKTLNDLLGTDTVVFGKMAQHLKKIQTKTDIASNGKIRMNYYLNHDVVPLYFERPNYSFVTIFLLIEQIKTWPIFSLLTPIDQMSQVQFVVWPGLLLWKSFYSHTKNSPSIIDPDGMPWIKIWVDHTKKYIQHSSKQNPEHCVLIKL